MVKSSSTGGSRSCSGHPVAARHWMRTLRSPASMMSTACYGCGWVPVAGLTNGQWGVRLPAGMDRAGRRRGGKDARFCTLALGLLGLVFCAAAPAAASARVLRVGTFHGIPGGFHNVQDAVDAAQQGDWILI